MPKNEKAGLINNQKESHEFKFTEIFDQEASQEEIFEKIAKPLTLSCLSGYNGTIFAYGQTGSGKTYTMSGADTWQLRGVIPRIISCIFDEIEERPGFDFNVYVTFMEIYNENGYDILDTKHSEAPMEKWVKIQLYEDVYGNLHLKNLSIHQIFSEQEGIDLLMMGNFIRHVSTTPSNQASSRSHCIFTIAIESREHDSEVIRTAKLHLVDLAGSERVAKTNINGKTFEESKHINLSLTYLEQVIIALHERQKDSRTHIPYRNSLMTTILRDSLGGNCKTVLIATMNTDSDHIEETISSAKFARRCSKLVATVTINEQMDINLVVQKLQAENDELRKQLQNRSECSTLSENTMISLQEAEVCKKQVAMFLSDKVTPKIIIGSVGQAFRCFQLFKEAMVITQEQCAEEIEKIQNKSRVRIRK